MARKMGAIRLMQMISALFLVLDSYGACEKQVEKGPFHMFAKKQALSSQIFSQMLEKDYRLSVRTTESITSFEEIGMETNSYLWNDVVVSVDDFGAVGDGITDDTKAFEDAWQEACSSVFATFFVPEGNMYLLKPINFSGPCQYPLTVQISGTIVAPEDPNVWIEANYWLLFNEVNNLAVGGGGRIDGRGQKWWAESCKINKTNPCTPAPTAVTFDSIKNLWVRNLSMENSPKFHLTFQNCAGVEANYLRVSAPQYSPNTDGIHISASSYVMVTDSIIGTGDDCISIVSESFNVMIQNVTCGPGHGISIGSLGKGNSGAEVSFVVVDGAYIHDTTNGLRIKTWQGGSGYAQGIRYSNIYMENVSNPIIIDQYYCDSPERCPNQTSAVRVSEVGYFNIRGTSATEQAIRFACSESVPCENIILQNIYLTLTSGDSATSFCENAMGFSLGFVTPPPCFQYYNQLQKEEMITQVMTQQPRNEL
ncbi:hypothetical protein SUGI_1141540 [Cryptomeria japonica]|uniref:probable polygalacturonase At1g80170 n=1 Tax=Cryptomeria japonica TaxID=3369 RepID=UPI002414C28D|nr:probable polygalacturonase At1g80170 [Cryptomeria japonica]GLJ53503.1 hypothetical protein SUGI_1141540 [Cryptomeria japonica]